jgi:hypothetical protein
MNLKGTNVAEKCTDFKSGSGFGFFFNYMYSTYFETGCWLAGLTDELLIKCINSMKISC